MAKDLNRFQGIGRLGKDADAKYIPSGRMVAKFSVAMNNEYTSNTGEKVKKVYWQDCEIWGPFAEAVSPYLKTGQRIYIDGRLDRQEWDADGVKHYRVVCHVETLNLLGDKRDDNDTPAAVSAKHNAPVSTSAPVDEEIPF